MENRNAEVKLKGMKTETLSVPAKGTLAEASRLVGGEATLIEYALLHYTTLKLVNPHRAKMKKIFDKYTVAVSTANDRLMELVGTNPEDGVAYATKLKAAKDGGVYEFMEWWDGGGKDE